LRYLHQFGVAGKSRMVVQRIHKKVWIELMLLLGLSALPLSL
jgi:hypothetical protein